MTQVVATGRQSTWRRQFPVLLFAAAFTLAVLAAYGFIVGDFVTALGADGLSFVLTDRDFANYWVAGRLVRSGEHPDLFTQSLYFPHLQALFGADYEIRNWGYPPHYLLLVSPLGYLEYKTAFVVFLGSSFLLFSAAVIAFKRVLAPGVDALVLALAVISYGLINVVTTQNGFLTGAFLLFGLALAPRRPMLAGLAFACLTVKPQLGFLIPLVLAFDRNWPAILWTIAWTLGLAAVSIAAFGLESWVLYLTETVEYQRSVTTDWSGIFLWMMPTVFGALRTLELSPGVAYYAQVPVSVGAAAAVVWLLYRELDPLRRSFVVLCGTLLVSPYAYNYDMGALAVCAALLAVAPRANDARVSAVVFAVIALLPAAIIHLGRASAPVAPVLLMLGLAAIAAGLRHRAVVNSEPIGAAAGDSASAVR